MLGSVYLQLWYIEFCWNRIACMFDIVLQSLNISNLCNFRFHAVKEAGSCSSYAKHIISSLKLEWINIVLSSLYHLIHANFHFICLKICAIPLSSYNFSAYWCSWAGGERWNCQGSHGFEKCRNWGRLHHGCCCISWGIDMTINYVFWLQIFSKFGFRDVDKVIWVISVVLIQYCLAGSSDGC